MRRRGPAEVLDGLRVPAEGKEEGETLRRGRDWEMGLTDGGGFRLPWAAAGH